jgi:hypothetical protein
MQAVCPDLIGFNPGSVFETLFGNTTKQLTGGPAPDRPVRLP